MSAAAAPEALKCELRAMRYKRDIDKSGDWVATIRPHRRELSEQVGLTGTYEEVSAEASVLNAEQHRSGGFDFLYFPEPLTASIERGELSRRPAH